jgi:hypothetical protein
MAAGLGFKTFTTGEVLTAGDVNGYLMQGINVFATTAARDAAITAPAEGQFAFTKDTNGLWYYDGAAWVASGATGDIEGVTAGVGISGGGTSGTVTVTNSMATAIDAKGDLVPGTGADTFSRLAVGSNGTVLTADSAEATGLKWATPSAPGFVGCKVSQSTDTFPHDTLTTINYSTEDFDTDAFHNTSTNTNRFTVPSGKAGKYLCMNVGMRLPNVNLSDAYLTIRVNGSEVKRAFPGNFPSNGRPTAYNFNVLNLSVSDYVDFAFYQASGSSITAIETGFFVFQYLGA